MYPELNRTMEVPDVGIVMRLLIDALNKRPGLDPRCYGSCYNATRAQQYRYLVNGRKALDKIRQRIYNRWGAWDNSDATRQALLDALTGGNNRLVYDHRDHSLDYTAGQDYHTEYRRHVQGVLIRFAEILKERKIHVY